MIQKIFDKTRQFFRRRRYLQIQNLMNIDAVEGFILDLGGGPASFFSARFPKSEQVILLEIDYNEAKLAKKNHPQLLVVIADGEQMPFADNSIELTVCNSVIEHVNSPKKLAVEIQRTSKNYFLQTPNGDFPLETHSFVAIPFYNLISWEWLQRLVCSLFGANFEYVKSVHYLSEKQLRDFFSEAFFVYEKALGLKKSFYIYYFRKQ